MGIPESTIAEFTIVRYGKRILKQLERGLALSALIVYGKHIEPPVARSGHVAQEIARDER